MDGYGGIVEVTLKVFDLEVFGVFISVIDFRCKLDVIVLL